MEHSRHEILVEAPIEHVWACFSDTSRWGEWMPATFSEFSGPVEEVGTTYQQSVRVMGFEQGLLSTFPCRWRGRYRQAGPMPFDVEGKGRRRPDRTGREVAELITSLRDQHSE